MKTNSTFTLATLGLAAILAPLNLAAQSDSMIVDVPFNFSVGTKVLPAGEYRVATEGHIVRLNSVDGNDHMLTAGFAADSGKRYVQPSLQFKRYGNRYFLAQIWAVGNAGTELSKSSAEREMTARNQMATPITLVASRR